MKPVVIGKDGANVIPLIIHHEDSVFTVHMLLFFSTFSLSTLQISCMGVVCCAMCNLF